MKNRRISERNYSYAKVLISDFDIIGYVRDISSSGLRLEVLEIGELFEGLSAVATIIPHTDLEIEPFNVRAEVRWIRENGPTISVGLQIASFCGCYGQSYFNSLLEAFRKGRQKQE